MHKPGTVFVLTPPSVISDNTADCPGDAGTEGSIQSGSARAQFTMRCLVEHALQPELDFVKEAAWAECGVNPPLSGHLIELVATKARKRALQTIEVSTTFPYVTSPSKLDTCWYMLAGNHESDSHLCRLTEDSVNPIRKIWNIFCPLTHVGKDIVTWSEKNPGQDAMHTITTHFVDMRNWAHAEFSGIWEHYGVYRSHGACFLVLRVTQSFGESDYLRNIYRWDVHGIAQVEGMSFSQALGGDFEKVQVESDQEGTAGEIECVIGMRQGAAGTIVFEGVSHEWVVYALKKERGEWYGKQKTPLGQQTFDFG